MQATGANQPLYKTAIQNGLPVVRFDGVDDFVAVDFSLGQPTTVFVVAKFLDTALDTLIDGFAGANVNKRRLYRNASTTYTLFAGSGGPVSAATTPEAFHSIGAVFNGASSEIRIDGGSAATGNPGAGASTGITVGAVAGAASDWANADIAEVLLYNTALSTTDRQSVESYLRGRWNTP